MVKKKKQRDFVLPSVDKFSSRKEWEDVCSRIILNYPDLLRLLMTTHERRVLVVRVAALQAIAAGKNYRQIGQELWLSPQTISGIGKAIKERSYRSYLERSKNERKKRIYSDGSVVSKSERRGGLRRRTKYGTIYLP
ncbi:MAG: hypothetical protein UY23_C0001G0325 [Candidatus Jorgensenbacteria bacterium GW2011_GWA1_48_11]|uniref:Uncharacterized protein n=1 Tax=Candidatus Jorgensenbacteria bacterium GW2011_GWA1_48_11 TaxID=1618660 RepID=A0A0G1UC81_9BACT|nr:MAG: hypothetical protein UY23_C0001G0325 [Candidatus Jorgensenbacteria bacterium GW2011_GWA1_48_11]KKW12210.1 MAG: hypothetical protein UY51_C0005G0452 [Candidatus Jorgensenbacteria bacterium GW2011_GWB1_49_9]